MSYWTRIGYVTTTSSLWLIIFDMIIMANLEAIDHTYMAPTWILLLKHRCMKLIDEECWRWCSILCSFYCHQALTLIFERLLDLISWSLCCRTCCLRCLLLLWLQRLLRLEISLVWVVILHCVVIGLGCWLESLLRFSLFISGWGILCWTKVSLVLQMAHSGNLTYEDLLLILSVWIYQTWSVLKLRYLTRSINKYNIYRCHNTFYLNSILHFMWNATMTECFTMHLQKPKDLMAASWPF